MLRAARPQHGPFGVFRQFGFGSSESPTRMSKSRPRRSIATTRGVCVRACNAPRVLRRFGVRSRLRCSDLSIELDVTLEELYSGAKLQLEINKQRICSHCRCSAVACCIAAFGMPLSVAALASNGLLPPVAPGTTTRATVCHYAVGCTYPHMACACVRFLHCRSLPPTTAAHRHKSPAGLAPFALTRALAPAPCPTLPLVAE